MTVDTRPLAYGYVRLNEVDREAATRWRAAIGDRCVRDGRRLVTTFCDFDCDGSILARPALTELLVALRAAPQAAVVVPDLTHLSAAQSIRGALLLLLHRTEHQLVTLQEANGQPNGLGITVDTV
jgi:DNA invertase Pin-like site-specific DNA recombinase